MVTKRTPLRRPVQVKFSAAAIAAFKRMEVAQIKCTCPPLAWDDKGLLVQTPWCRACAEWQAQYEVLIAEIKMPTLDRSRALKFPDSRCPYRPGSYAAEKWEREQNAEPFEVYYALKEAAGL